MRPQFLVPDVCPWCLHVPLTPVCPQFLVPDVCPWYLHVPLTPVCPQFLRSGALTDIQLDDQKDFKLTDQAMTAMGMSDNEKMSIYTLIAALLHLGNVAFEENHDDVKGQLIVLRQPLSADHAGLISHAMSAPWEADDI